MVPSSIPRFCEDFCYEAAFLDVISGGSTGRMASFPHADGLCAQTGHPSTFPTLGLLPHASVGLEVPRAALLWQSFSSRPASSHYFRAARLAPRYFLVALSSTNWRKNLCISRNFGRSFQYKLTKIGAHLRILVTVCSTNVNILAGILFQTIYE